MTAATFHSVCALLLRANAGVFGRTDAYTIYDQADLRRVIEWLVYRRATLGAATTPTPSLWLCTP